VYQLFYQAHDCNGNHFVWISMNARERERNM
jgi:hypothetical protein